MTKNLTKLTDYVKKRKNYLVNWSYFLHYFIIFIFYSPGFHYKLRKIYVLHTFHCTIKNKDFLCLNCKKIERAQKKEL